MKSYAFPGNINQEILQLGSLQIPYMRTAEFSAINKDSEKILLELIGCKEGKTIIYTASGTGSRCRKLCNNKAKSICRCRRHFWIPLGRTMCLL